MSLQNSMSFKITFISFQLQKSMENVEKSNGTNMVCHEPFSDNYPSLLIIYKV